VAVTSAGPYANLHLGADAITPASHHSVFHRLDANGIKALIINWHHQLLYFLKNFWTITIVLTNGTHVYVPPFNQTTS